MVGFKYSRLFNPRAYARFGVSLANRYVLDKLERLLIPIPDEPLRHPPIFFLGAPRSGSTLMTQVITDALDLGYISNRHCQWFGAPALAERLLHPTAGRPISDYRSVQGVTKGSYAPAECGEWWYRFFRRRPPYVTLNEVDPRKMRRFRQSVAALTNAFDRPILFKNLYASLRIQAIAHYLPESLFIVTHRDEVDNGHSLLDARYQRFSNYEAWLSVEPPQTEVLKTLPVHQQVIEQIRHIHEAIERDLEIGRVPASRRLDLSYEEFCANPSRSVGALLAFLASNGYKAELRGDVPLRFKRGTEIRIDSTVYVAMADYAQRS
ncbi:MAG: sulfotransferase [Thiocapsa sp.]|uniref:sulfotransferase n=1 Tax=Thiocapsa sp. TaxID=2024551 RepID=UPI001BCF6A29|nr:sulfotransferase [Thiocapsa sp.]QVL49808.1 MAG: sulfotransferase [Thiocapsa sp.]